MARRGSVAGLDIGTTKVAAIVADVDDDGDVHVVGAGTAPSTGIRRGVVVDLDATATAIEQALDRAQRMAGLEVRAAYVAVSGEHITSADTRGVVAVARSDHEIAEGDVARVIDAARMAALPPSDREIIHLLPRDFIVDGQDGVKRPVGMYGTRLEVEAHLVTGVATALANVAKCAQRAGLEVEAMVLEPLASAEAVLTPEERELGVVVADIGGGTTSVAVFANGGLCHVAILPVAGQHLTGDIAVGLRTAVPEAEKLKVRWGAASPAYVSEGDMIEVFAVGGREPRVLPRQRLAEVIEPRLDEIFALVEDEIRRSGFLHRVPAGIVVTGGTAQLEGLDSYAEHRLRMPARIGAPSHIAGLVEAVRSPAFATGVGLVLHGARGRAYAGALARNGAASFWERARVWLRDVLQGG
ncbi:MAG: cell division protein FtsA [Armatimonadota bacterium]|nr:cell division protein FtsA [Armatimonadota bacterium]MDR7534347.1 cell division protein FtsA [Armatimonadota bacterium]MDR7536017.1 cell division protein FtsA [Armatimonadota bacterium]